MKGLKSSASVARTLYRRSRWRANGIWETLRGAPGVLLENASRNERPGQLVVLDDVFPLPWSGFRLAEFNAYLAQLPGVEVHSSADPARGMGSQGSFEQIVAAYGADGSSVRGRIRKFNALRRLDHFAAGYSLFAATTGRFLATCERSRLPLIFTLYPGGGFALEDARSDATLRRIFDSKVFRKVIATQRITREYLLNRGLCDADRIELIYGGVFRSTELTGQVPPHRRYLSDKPTLDVCFVAHKYMPQGRDKGYDRFVAAARLLATRFEDVRFHVVGPFSADDVPVGDLGGRLRFYGSQPTEFFRDFYAGMDMILSPNLPFLLRPGAFDGFPTGSCMEAGMCGVAVFCTDPLDLNVALRDGEDLVLIPPEPARIADMVADWRAHPDRLARVGDSASVRFRDLFGVEAQMLPRFRLISEVGSSPRSR